MESFRPAAWPPVRVRSFSASVLDQFLVADLPSRQMGTLAVYSGKVTYLKKCRLPTTTPLVACLWHASEAGLGTSRPPVGVSAFWKVGLQMYHKIFLPESDWNKIANWILKQTSYCWCPNTFETSEFISSTSNNTIAHELYKSHSVTKLCVCVCGWADIIG